MQRDVTIRFHRSDQCSYLLQKESKVSFRLQLPAYPVLSPRDVLLVMIDRQKVPKKIQIAMLCVLPRLLAKVHHDQSRSWSSSQCNEVIACHSVAGVADVSSP
jgi:hypothetical protein